MGYSPYFSVFLHINWVEPPDFVQPSTGCLLPAFISLVDFRMVSDGPDSRWGCLEPEEHHQIDGRAQANRVDDFSGLAEISVLCFSFFSFFGNQLRSNPCIFFHFFAGLGRLLSA